jgi:hypothetical protein
MFIDADSERGFYFAHRYVWRSRARRSSILPARELCLLI